MQDATYNAAWESVIVQMDGTAIWASKGVSVILNRRALPGFGSKNSFHVAIGQEWPGLIWGLDGRTPAEDTFVEVCGLCGDI